MTLKSVLTKNRGEWAEVVCVFEAIADGKIPTVTLVDGKLSPTGANVLISRVSIVRGRDTITYDIHRQAGTPVSVVMCVNGMPTEFPIEEVRGDFKNFKEHVRVACDAADIAAFPVPESEALLDKYAFGAGKSKSTLKQDIDLTILAADGTELPVRGFSVKSFVGGDPTVFNASRVARFQYRIDGNKLEEAKKLVDEVHCQAKKPRAWAQNLFRDLDKIGAFTYRIRLPDESFERNLKLLDSQMPVVIGFMLLQAYITGDKTMQKGLDRTIAGDPLEYGVNASTFYSYRVKHFLRAAALGFSSSKPWNGMEGAEGGMIMIRKNWEMVCFLSGKSEFEDYLLASCRFETPSSNPEKHGGFGIIHEEPTGHYIDLLLQVREKDPFEI